MYRRRVPVRTQQFALVRRMDYWGYHFPRLLQVKHIWEQTEERWERGWVLKHARRRGGAHAVRSYPFTFTDDPKPE